jgi:hypothetical protein
MDYVTEKYIETSAEERELMKYALTLLFSRLGTKRMEEQHIYIASPIAARPRFQRHFYYLLLETKP